MLFMISYSSLYLHYFRLVVLTVLLLYHFCVVVCVVLIVCSLSELCTLCFLCCLTTPWRSLNTCVLTLTDVDRAYC